MNAAACHERNQPLPGQSLVLFALMSLLLLAGLGLIFDAGLDYSNRRVMQNAADTAAIRGARVIAQRAAGGANASVLDEVVETALANGVPDAADVMCTFLNDGLDDLGTCDNGPVPDDVTGVRVRVSETHTPIVLRALGILTSGTAATAAAQVQMVDTLYGNDFPFMVCGVDTAVVGGSPQDILVTTLKDDTEPGPPPSPVSYQDVATPFGIQDSAYSYDWNQREPDGSFTPLGGPQFIIYGTGIEDCGFTNWKGLAPESTTNVILAYGDADTDTTDPSPTYDQSLPLEVVTGSIGNAIDTSPTRSINGPQGCKATTNPLAAYRTDCIMLLPIGNNVPVCPTQCFFTTEADRAASFHSMQLRRWGAFYVVYDSTSGQYWGRLIKNYPMHTDGETGWDADTYEGPLNITLIQAN